MRTKVGPFDPRSQYIFFPLFGTPPPKLFLTKNKIYNFGTQSLFQNQRLILKRAILTDYQFNPYRFPSFFFLSDSNASIQKLLCLQWFVWIVFQEEKRLIFFPLPRVWKERRLLLFFLENSLFSLERENEGEKCAFPFLDAIRVNFLIFDLQMDCTDFYCPPEKPNA